MADRLTPREEEAIVVALSASLASPVLDGYDDDDAEEQRLRAVMESARMKLWQRHAERSTRAYVRGLRGRQ